MASPQARSMSRDRSPDHDKHDEVRSRSGSLERTNGARGRAGSRSRSRSPARDSDRSRSRSRERDYRERSYSRSRSRSKSPDLPRSAKIVIEKLTKNVNEKHLREIFGVYGDIQELEMPMNKQFMMNKGISYILYTTPEAAADAIAHMHEAQLDGALISVSIVLPRRRFSRSPPPKRPPPNRFGEPHRFRDPAPRGGPAGGDRGFGRGPPGRSPPPYRGGRSPPRYGGRGRGGPPPRDRYDQNYSYRPRSHSPSRSPPPRRRRSPSYSDRSRSRSPPRRRERSPGGRGGHGGSGGGRRRRSPSYSSRGSRSRSPRR